MATSWKQAQEREVEFWQQIYVNNAQDIESYRPITDEKALAFCTKTLNRFNLELPDFAGISIGDVGCGPYGLVRGIDVFFRGKDARPEKVYGIDPLMDTYIKFKTLPIGDSIELITSKGEAIPLKDSACDFVFSVNVVDHVESPRQVLEECKRITKVGGRTFFSVHVVRTPFTLLGPLLFLIDKNHPHHFSEAKFLRMASDVFGTVKLANRVSILEDQPDFTFRAIFTAPSKWRATKRWLSTYLLRSIYIECEN